MTDALLSRRAILAGLGGLAVGRAAWAGAPESSIVPLPRPLRAPVPGEPAPKRDVLAEVNLSGQSAFVVADARTGEVLDSAQPDLALPTASVAKSMTAHYVLQTFGADYRFPTRVFAAGPVVDGVVQGDVILAGYGDPMLDTDDLAALAANVVEVGVTGATGRFVVDPGPMPRIPSIDPGQPDHVAYSPAVGGLTLNFNRVYFEWLKNADGYDVSLDARGARFNPTVSMARMDVVDRPGPVFEFQAQGSTELWTVARGALGKKGAQWLPVRHPALYAGQAFQALAADAGLALPAPIVSSDNRDTAETLLAENLSLPVDRVMRSMLYFSTNIIAEVTGMGASFRRGFAPQTLAQSARHMNDWLADRMGVTGFAFADHSGLGEDTRVTPHALANALVKIGPDSRLAGLLRRYPLRAEVKGMEVVAKTGTLNFVSGLAGFATTKSGRDLAFAILSSDLPRRASLTKEERERPPGAHSWATRARYQEAQLLAQWNDLY